MITLGLEFGTADRAVALARGETVVGEARRSGGGRGVPVFELILEVLERAGHGRGEVTRVAVGLGPGSFMGIRQALAVAIGWTAATGVEVVGVSTFESCAAGMRREGVGGVVTLIADAQRGEVYAQTFRMDGAEIGCGAMELKSSSEITRLARGGERLLRVGEISGKELSGVEPARIRPDLTALLGAALTPVEAGRLEPIQLRPVSYVKAPRPRFQG